MPIQDQNDPTGMEKNPKLYYYDHWKLLRGSFLRFSTERTINMSYTAPGGWLGSWNNKNKLAGRLIVVFGSYI